VNEGICLVRRSGSIAIVACLTLVLTACGGDEARDPTPTPDESATAAALATSAAPPPTSTPRAAPVLGDIVWTTDVDAQTKEPTSPVDAFTTEASTIYAALLVRNLPPGTVLTAEWTYNATSLDGLTTRVAVVAGAGEEWVVFHLTRSEEPWPDGVYAISVSVDGEAAVRAEVGVEEP
jgi:hypothetical protein